MYWKYSRLFYTEKFILLGICMNKPREKIHEIAQKFFVFEYEQKIFLHSARQTVLSYKIIFLICLLTVKEIHLCHFVLRELPV